MAEEKNKPRPDSTMDASMPSFKTWAKMAPDEDDEDDPRHGLLNLALNRLETLFSFSGIGYVCMCIGATLLTCEHMKAYQSVSATCNFLGIPV